MMQLTAVPTKAGHVINPISCIGIDIPGYWCMPNVFVVAVIVLRPNYIKKTIDNVQVT